MLTAWELTYEIAAHFIKQSGSKCATLIITEKWNTSYQRQLSKGQGGFYRNNMSPECPAHFKFKVLNRELNFRLLFQPSRAYVRNWFLPLFNFLSYALRKIPFHYFPRGSFWIYSCLQTAKYYNFFLVCLGLPWWLRQQRACLKCKRPGLNPWVRKIPRRRKWQPTPVFLPGGSQGWRSMAGYSPWGCKESDTQSNWYFSLFTVSIIS